MLTVILVAVFVVLVVSVVVFVVNRRTARDDGDLPGLVSRREDVQARAARHAEAERRGTELIARRVDLDNRRGALGGDSQLDVALLTLERRFKEGEIGEAVFEAEKRRLLGG